MLIGIDAGTKTGWAIADTSGRIVESGVMDFTKRRGESNGALFLKFRRWLSELLSDKTRPPFLVCYEQAHHRGGPATEIGVGLATRIQEICTEYGYEYIPVHTGTLKKSATGSGSAGKEQMIERAARHLGRQPIDDNEADAVHLAMMAVKEAVPF